MESDDDTLGYGALSPLMDGFRINWMTLWDGENPSRVFWRTDNWDMALEEREETFDSEILKCACVSWQIDFTSKAAIDKFKIQQKIILHGQCIESWDFYFGFVMPNTTNTWD